MVFVQLTTMRTREMREKDVRVSDNRYKYTLVRVRTADGYVIQVRKDQRAKRAENHT